jgi:hypothetical protein
MGGGKRRSAMMLSAAFIRHAVDTVDKSGGFGTYTGFVRKFDVRFSAFWQRGDVSVGRFCADASLPGPRRGI